MVRLIKPLLVSDILANTVINEQEIGIHVTFKLGILITTVVVMVCLDFSDVAIPR